MSVFVIEFQALYVPQISEKEPDSQGIGGMRSRISGWNWIHTPIKTSKVSSIILKRSLV